MTASILAQMVFLIESILPDHHYAEPVVFLHYLYDQNIIFDPFCSVKCKHNTYINSSRPACPAKGGVPYRLATPQCLNCCRAIIIAKSRSPQSLRFLCEECGGLNWQIERRALVLSSALLE